MTTYLYVARYLYCMTVKETEGVAVDRTDATSDSDEATDSPAVQPTQSTTHEKADMVVVTAAYPGDT